LNERTKEELYNKLANPDILTAKANEINNENTAFVGNIGFDAKEADVREFFSSCGQIQTLVMPKGKIS
jgi:RNA recognition motif-containing protein